jgi:transcriptional regulator with XRE-family HTH domain
MFERRVSHRELSRRTGLAPPMFSLYVSGRRDPTTDTIEIVAAALGVEPAAFFEYRRRAVLERVGDDVELVDALWRRLRAS